MNILDTMATRRSIRKYQNKPIEDGKLNKVLESLQLAPSGNNRQPIRFVVLKSEEMKKKLVEQSCNQEFIKSAPVIVVACCEKGREFDAAIAIDHLTLAATSEGLGSCWIRWFDKAAAAIVLGVPDNYEVAVIMPIGYADEVPAKRPRLPMSELIRYEKF